MGTQTGHLVVVLGEAQACCGIHQIGNYNKRTIELSLWRMKVVTLESPKVTFLRKSAKNLRERHFWAGNKASHHSHSRQLHTFMLLHTWHEIWWLGTARPFLRLLPETVSFLVGIWPYEKPSSIAPREWGTMDHLLARRWSSRGAKKLSLLDSIFSWLHHKAILAWLRVYARLLFVL